MCKATKEYTGYEDVLYMKEKPKTDNLTSNNNECCLNLKYNLNALSIF